MTQEELIHEQKKEIEKLNEKIQDLKNQVYELEQKLQKE